MSDQLADVAGTSSPSGRDPVRRLAIIIAGLVLVAATLGGLALARGWEYSPYDEAAHVDYAWKVSHGEIPYPGSVIEPEILAEWSCHGQSNVILPPCGSGAPAAAYPARGENYLQHPPTYYAITGAIARVLPLELIGADFTTSARLISIAWLALGMVLLYCALRIWGVPWHLACLAAALPPTLHLVLLSSVTVTNDVTALPAGAVAVWLLGRMTVEKKPSTVILVIATAAFTSMKVLNALPFLGIAAVLLFAAMSNRWAHRLPVARRRAVATSAGILGVVAAIDVAAMIARRAMRVPGWESPVAGINSDEITGLPLSEWSRTLFVGLAPGGGTRLTDGSPDAAAAWGLLLPVLLAAAPLALLALHRFPAPGWTLAATVGIAMLAMPTVIQLQTFISSGGDQYFPVISPRYSLSLIPLQIACLALIAARRRWYAAAVVVGGGALVAALVVAVRG